MGRLARCAEQAAVTRLALDPARVAAEAAEFTGRMALAMQQLATMDVRTEGCSARAEVHREDKTVLWRYARTAPDAGLPPLVICYALVNRPYMLDLQPDRSLIRGLLARGPRRVSGRLGLSGPRRQRPVAGRLREPLPRRAASTTCAATHDIPSVNLLGVCQGGTMAICHAALHPERVRNLVTMVTPVDFHTDDNLLCEMGAANSTSTAMVDTLGNVPGELLNAAFIALMPLRLTVRKYAGLADIAARPRRARELPAHGALDPRQPGPGGHRFPAVHPRLLPGKPAGAGRAARSAGSAVDPRAIDCPILNVYAKQDHLVPPSASRPLGGLVSSSDYTPFEFDGGHIGIYVSRSAQELLPRKIAQWLGSR